jgi:hypothetical protein
LREQEPHGLPASLLRGHHGCCQKRNQEKDQRQLSHEDGRELNLPETEASRASRNNRYGGEANGEADDDLRERQLAPAPDRAAESGFGHGR